MHNMIIENEHGKNEENAIYELMGHSDTSKTYLLFRTLLLLFLL
jgi:hypothetical protein